MKKILNVFLVLISCFFTCGSYAAATNSMSVSIQYFDGSGAPNPAGTPSKIPTTAGSVSGLQITITGTMQNAYSVTENSTASGPTSANWGVYFSGSASPGTSPIACSTNSSGSCDNLGSNFTVLSGTTVPASTGTSPNFVYTAGGSVNLIVTIKGFTGNTLPADFANLFQTNAVAVGFFYAASGVAASPMDVADYALWQADLGTLIAGPVMQTGFNSVKALQNNFQIVNISPPTSNAAACPAAAGTTSSASCTIGGDGSATGGGGGAVGGLLQSVTSNSVSGYVVGFWNEATCSNNAGSFVFDQNWEAYNYSGGYSQYSCNYSTIAYSNNVAQDKGGDTNLPTLGCNSITPLPVFYTPYNSFTTALTPDSGAIPYTGRNNNPKADLAEIIANGTTPTQGTGSCISYIYLTPSQTYTSSQIAQNSIYGIVVWALNSASNYDNTAVPNYSLNHSNVVYTTTANFLLASTTKDSSLGLTTDCFVVTAASGNPNSPAVIYWRFLRDSYLTPIGFTKFYYKHARVWAHWLDQHPSLKPPLNFIFEKSGYTFFHIGQFIKEVNYDAKTEFHKFINYVSGLLDNKASAAELLAFDAVPQDNQNNKSDFGFDQDSQQNMDVVPEDMNGDPFFTLGPKKSNQQPEYDFAIKGGILIPTQDKEYYDAYYSSQPTMYAEVGLSRLFWTKNIGYSVGLQGRYLTNSQQDSASVLGSQESYTRTFYAITGEVMVGLRYRNPNFTYLQPGLFAGGGLTRFRETASASGTTSSGSQGVTEYSPIYEGGVTLDVSLSAIAGQTELDVGDVLNEVLLRFSASYNQNTSQALSSTGYFVGAGFAFLIN